MVSVAEAGLPDLPVASVSLIVPEDIDMAAEVISASVREYQDILVAPSRGNLYRTQDPSTVPYLYSEAYDRPDSRENDFAELRTPFVLRDFTGQTVTFRPFRYDPLEGRLSVCFAATVRIRPAAKNTGSEIRLPASVDETFSHIYSRRFINYDHLNYAPLSEEGNMLIVADSAFMSLLRPFAAWKNRTGLRTEMVSIDAVGRSSAALKSFVESYYQSNGLTFLLLVGDHAQIPAFNSTSGPSDPSYGYLSGNDSYAEVIVGRFSANDSAELMTQIERTLRYEQYSDTAASWLGRAVCIASDQGPGDDNEMDYVHARLMRQDLLAYTYTDADELYDGDQGGADSAGSPSVADLVAAMDNGRGLITYTGHGSSGGFVTTGFGISDIPGLHNADRLPFIWSVACVNGNFIGGTCLAEGLLRSTDSTGSPTGAVACLMSTINQSWDPPMDGQDEMVDLLTMQYPTNVKLTFGGISVNGCMHMNDQYGPAGDEMTDTWTCFGDPSLMVRTAAPVLLTVSHPAVLFEGGTGFSGICSLDGAKACVTLKDSVLDADNVLTNSFSFGYGTLHAGDTLLLTVTGQNVAPYQASIPVLPSLSALEEPITGEWSIYPNPSSGQVRVKTVADGAAGTFLLYDLSGRLVRSLATVLPVAGEFLLDFSGISSGCYRLVMSDMKGVHIGKLMIR
ncbi:MAG: Gingipain precursor [Bacteroidota bacterium]|jgi:hypothetical protein